MANPCEGGAPLHGGDGAGSNLTYKYLRSRRRWTSVHTPASPHPRRKTGEDILPNTLDHSERDDSSEWALTTFSS